MERVRKLELIRRSLALRHKLKVHESMEQPETHEDLSVALLAKWDLEDELHAIEQILAEARDESVQEKKELIEQGILKKGKPDAEASNSKASKKTKSAKKKVPAQTNS